MTALLDERLRVLAAQTHTLEEKVSSLGWMAGADADEWGLQREVFSVSQLGQYAPFRPAKAVEA